MYLQRGRDTTAATVRSLPIAKPRDQLYFWKMGEAAKRRLAAFSDRFGAEFIDRALLSGVKVLDWTSMAAGPGAAAMLADFGADVVHVEVPKGDPWRRVLRGPLDTPSGAVGHGSAFEHDNRGKRSVTLDLTQSAGVRAFHALLATADVLICNTRMAGTQRLGLDYETLRRRYPRLVYAHLTAWGREGPMRDAPGYDAGAFWAGTGMLDLMRENDEAGNGIPRLPGAAGDHATSLALVAGIALALFNRERTGQGRLVDVSLFRAGLWCNGMFLSAAAADLSTAQKLRDPKRLGATFRAYKCRDGADVQLLGYQPKRHTPALLRAMGLEALPADPAALNELFARKDAAEWEAIFDREGVWYTRVMHFEDLLGGGEVAGGKMSQAAQQAAETGAFLTGESDTRGFAVVASPIKVGHGLGASNEPPSGAQGTARAPLLAEHLEAVMAEAGVSTAQFAELKAQGAFGQPPTPARSKI